MPFPDEMGRAVAVVEYNPEWPSEFADLADRLHAALDDRALAIDHIGSTSVPDLADYGQIKAPATDLLMTNAEQWAIRTNWT
ncbi:GrpB family protein [Kribbella sp. NPDC004875]|uniref:GrpB family protein n=1 Tax=Kribbella sp. NPDC004875 TaxID=3364107 RepID=UPI0036A21AED